jgi:hypothetical protein
MKQETPLQMLQYALWKLILYVKNMEILVVEM